MIYLAIICGLLLAALLWRESRHSLHLAEREKTWDLERGALLSRIQHPEVIPVPETLTAGAVELGEHREEDEIELVGTVQDGIEESLNG